MPRITLVCSAHRENGLCNVPELLRILQTLEPEVAFLERQPSGVAPDWSLESKAIAKYSESTAIRRVIVEQEEAPASLYPEMEMVWDCVEQTSEEYVSLGEGHHLRAHRYGFEYLNTDVFAATEARLSEIEDSIIRRMRDQRLIRALERWRLIHQRREQDMVCNIYEYSRQHVFGTGVFLVGAVHKPGVVKAIGQYSGPDAGSIGWAFAYDDARSLGTT